MEALAKQRQLKLAFVGCGVVFKHHLEAIAAQHPRRIIVTALVEPHAERRAAASKAIQEKLKGEPPHAFASLKEALDADPGLQLFEAVDIMVPSLGGLHEEVALEAQKGGRHVHLEKPIAVTLASAERIIAAGRQHAPDRVLMIAENSQYWHEVVRAKQIIDQGAIGEILTVRAKFWESGHPALNEWAAAGSYDAGEYICRGPEGFVFDGGLHWLRPLRMLLGKPVRVSAVAGRTLVHMKGPGMMQALISFENGVTAVFESVLAPGAISDQPFFVIQGSKGEIVIDGFAGGCRLYTVVEGAPVTTDLNADRMGPVGWDTGYTGELEDFAACVLDGKEPEAVAQEAVEDLRLMLALMKAAKTQQWEHVSDVEADLALATLGLEV